MVFYWNFSDSKSPQTSRTILADLSKAAVCIFSIRPPISNSSSPLSKHSETVPSVPFTTGIAVNLKFLSFLSSLERSKYLSPSLSLIFTLWSAETAKSTSSLLFFFPVIITSSRLLARIRWSVCISKSQRISCVSIPRGLPSPPCYVFSSILFALIFFIRYVTNRVVFVITLLLLFVLIEF